MELQLQLTWLTRN